MGENYFLKSSKIFVRFVIRIEIKANDIMYNDTCYVAKWRIS